MIHLKTKTSGHEQQFAVLLDPNIQIGAITNDKELYHVVRACGFAKIGVFDDVGFTVKAENILTPQEFEANWIGD
jgi:hypothetical protein